MIISINDSSPDYYLLITGLHQQFSFAIQLGGL